MKVSGANLADVFNHEPFVGRWFKFLAFGRLVIVWDTKRPVDDNPKENNRGN